MEDEEGEHADDISHSASNGTEQSSIDIYDQQCECCHTEEEIHSARKLQMRQNSDRVKRATHIPTYKYVKDPQTVDDWNDLLLKLQNDLEESGDSDQFLRPFEEPWATCSGVWGPSTLELEFNQESKTAQYWKYTLLCKGQHCYAGEDRPYSMQEVADWESEYLGHCHRGGKLAVTFSGGGIRAASQGIGVLRFLKGKGLLHSILYLSGVSGGTYSGTGFMSHILAQEEDYPWDDRRSSAFASDKTEEILSKAFDSLEDHLKEKGNLVSGIKDDDAPSTFNQKFGPSRKLGLWTVGYFAVLFPAVLYRLSLLFAFVDLTCRVVLPFILIISTTDPVDCGGSSPRNINQEPHLEDVIGYGTQLSDLVRLSWTNGVCFTYSVWYFDVNIVDNGSQAEYLAVGSFLAPQTILFWMCVTLGGTAICAMWKGYCCTETWSSSPMAYRAQQYNISIAYSFINLFTVLLWIWSVLLVVALNFSFDSLYYSGHVTDGIRRAVFVLCAALIAILHNVIMRGIVSPDPLVNAVTTLTAFLFWWFFTDILFPAFNTTKGFKMQYLQDDITSAWEAVLVFMPCFVVVCIPCTRFLIGALGFVRQSTLRSTFYFWKTDPTTGKPKFEEPRFSEINRGTDHEKPWPVPPIYICNTTQHDVIDSRSLVAPAAAFYRDTAPTTYNHFEITSHHWGNPVVGRWKIPKESSMSTPMSTSAAATSQTLGTSISRTGWMGSLGPVISMIMGVFGMEMGRAHMLRTRGNEYTHECKLKSRILEFSSRRIIEALLLIISMSLSIYLIFEMKNVVRNNFQGAPIGYVNGSGACDFEDVKSCGILGRNHDDLSYYNAAVVTYCDQVKQYRTIDFIQYLARYDPTTSNLCSDQEPWNSDSFQQPNNFNQQPFVDREAWCTAHCKSKSLSSEPWFKEITHKVKWPIVKGDCQDFSYNTMWNLIKQAYPDSTHGFKAANLQHATVQGRYACTDLYGYIVTIFVIIVYFCITISLSASFSKLALFRSMLYSHTAQAVRRTLDLVMVVPSLHHYPPPEVFLTDGGHIDNTGAYPLLARQCRLILCLDSDPTRECSSWYILAKLSREKLGLSWEKPPEETSTVDAHDMFLDFRLPRARLVSMGGAGGKVKSMDGSGDLKATNDPKQLDERFEFVGNAMRGIKHWKASDPTEVFYRLKKETNQSNKGTIMNEPGIIKGLISHARIRDGHVYLYFMTDQALKTAFENFPHIRNHFRICQALEPQYMTGQLSADGFNKQHNHHYLHPRIMREETLRHSVHFKVKYANGNTGDVYYLRAEVDPDDMYKVHRYLEKHEPSPGLPWTTMGKYPAHSTIGEGYTWRHVNAYAELANTACQHAWSARVIRTDEGDQEIYAGMKAHLQKHVPDGLVCSDRPAGADGAHWTDEFQDNTKSEDNRGSSLKTIRSGLSSLTRRKKSKGVHADSDSNTASPATSPSIELNASALTSEPDQDYDDVVRNV